MVPWQELFYIAFGLDEAKMNRRAFLQLFVGTVAVATIPIPKFLLPKEEKVPIFMGIDPAFGSESVVFSTEGGVLTQEMIEQAALRSAMEMGQPDRMYMSMKSYKKVAKIFGYKVIYRGDDIVHARI